MPDNNDQRFRSVLSAVLGVPAERVTDDLSPETTDTWDSLNHINVISALEQEFSITLPTETLGDSQSIPKLKALLAERGVRL
ncbi:MAG: acyl carrier protein [Phycisphaerae bacterium]